MNEQLRTSAEGRQLIEDSEGFREHAYQDGVGVWTIGFGHTGHDVKPGMIISREYADNLLAADLTKAEAGVKRQVKVALNQHQFDALVDFVFNLGEGALHNSHLLTYLNQGHYDLAAHEFPRWCHAGGQIEHGLVVRRAKEKELFERHV